MDLSLEKRIEEWRDKPWLFAEDVLRTDGDSGGIAPLRLEDYQRDFMAATNKWRRVNKSRQVGYSFLFGVESLTRAVLRPGQMSIFVSYNLDDSREKINTIHKLVDASPALRALADFELLKCDVRVRPKWTTRWSSVRSLPCRPVRGKTKADLYLDEIAHYTDAETIYLGSAPATVRASAGAGQVTVASTPNGKEGVFWECCEGSRAAPFWAQNVPWWHSRYLCSDPDEAIRLAPLMAMEDRVQKYGLKNLKEIFEGMVSIDFEQEFECAFLDSGQAYYPLDLLEANMVEGSSLCEHLAEVVAEMRDGGELFLGVDIGRHKDTTEVVVIERYPDDTSPTLYYYDVRLVMTMDRWDTERQGDELLRILDIPEVTKLWIDTTGIGLPIGERLQAAFPDKVVGVVFTVAIKERLAVHVRRLFEMLLLDLPDVEAEQASPAQRRQAKNLISHIRSIHRSPATGRHAHYDAKSNHHHGDMFWGLALACICSFEDLKPGRAASDAR